MNIIGLDLSLTGTGIVVLRDSRIVYQELVTTKPGTTDMQRIITIMNQITEVLTTYAGPDCLVVIEGPSYGSNTSSIHTLGKLAGVVELSLVLRNITYLIVPPTSLKKLITGKGNAKKEQMLLQIYKKYGIEFHDNNLADAFALCKWGEATLEGKKNEK
jgi:crossover junction endodeoxyribonuclease RuvC